MRYFECPEKHGIFVPIEAVSLDAEGIYDKHKIEKGKKEKKEKKKREKEKKRKRHDDSSDDNNESERNEKDDENVDHFKVSDESSEDKPQVIKKKISSSDFFSQVHANEISAQSRNWQLGTWY